MSMAVSVLAQSKLGLVAAWGANGTVLDETNAISSIAFGKFRGNISTISVKLRDATGLGQLLGLPLDSL